MSETQTSTPTRLTYPAQGAAGASQQSEEQQLVAISQKIATAVFPSGTTCEVKDVQDPETDDSWLELHIGINGDVDPALIREAHRRYTSEWTKAVSPSQALAVRLVIDFI